ncbi:hypothetical protein EV182_007064 [Spiromyces aspiralis]|uniref:Uncharacterized protein n=1 Tax=Spiromyces aspiralis TaxID=68401 RepID=A0ACC1HMW0_9FUNG|nr:hypothetical protein EV182_007064 [Spiromyces aspiralis]
MPLIPSSPADMLASTHTFQARSSGATSSSSGNPTVALGLIFRIYYLRTDHDYAVAYVCLILMGIAERLLSLGADFTTPSGFKPRRIAFLLPHAMAYYVIAMIRFILMIAVMNQYVPIFLITCLGLTLGQAIAVVLKIWIKGLLSRYSDTKSTNSDPELGKGVFSEPCC